MQFLVNGLVQGVAIGTVGMAFAAVYRPTRVFHMGLAGILSACPFIAFALWQFLPLAVAMALSVCIGGGLSLGCEVLGHARLIRLKSPPTVHLVSGLGMYIVMVQVIVILCGNDTRVFRQEMSTTVRLAGIVVSGTQIAITLMLLGQMVLFTWWINRTEIGLRLRGLAENPELMQLLGHDVGRLRRVSFICAGLLGASVSLATAYDLGFDAHAGLPTFLLGAVAALIGKENSLVSAMTGGLVLGMTRSATVWYFSSGWQDAATFCILSGYLLTRPVDRQLE